jgi:hypothetical protein
MMTETTTPETDDDDATEMTTCDNCSRDMTEDAFDSNGGLCAECLAGTFTCAECAERTFKIDAHTLHKTMCEGCGDEKVEEEAQEALEAAQSELQELVDQLTGLDDLAVIKKALAALKRLQPKP